MLEQGIHTVSQCGAVVCQADIHLLDTVAHRYDDRTVTRQVTVLLNQCVNLIGSSVCFQRVVHQFCYARLHAVAHMLEQGIHTVS